MVRADIDRTEREGYFAQASAPASEAVDVEKIVTEELRKLPDPLPVGIAQLGRSGLGRKALQILRKAGVTEYDPATYRKAIQQAIRDAVSAKRKV